MYESDESPSVQKQVEDPLRELRELLREHLSRAEVQMKKAQEVHRASGRALSFAEENYTATQRALSALNEGSSVETNITASRYV